MRTDHVLRRALSVALFGCAALGASAQGLLDDFAVAIASDRAEEVSRLVARGMDPNSVDERGDTALCTAARNGSVRSIDVLLAAKADPNRPNRFNDMPLMLAAL